MKEYINCNSENKEKPANCEKSEETFNVPDTSKDNFESESQLKKTSSFISKKKAVILFIAVVVVILLTIIFTNLGYIVFSISYNTGNYDLAENIQNWSFNSERTNSNIETFIANKSNKSYQDFLNKKITYEQATKELDLASKYYNNEEIVKKLNNLQKSRDAFKKAQEYENEGKILEGLLEYTKVIKEDKDNYEVAQLKLKNNKKAVKEKATLTLEDYLSDYNFEDGLQYIEKLEKLFDNDFDSYKERLNSIKKEYNKQQAQENQPIEIVSVSIYKPEYSLFKYAKIVAKNISPDIFTSTFLAVLCFDEDGYPVRPNDEFFSTQEEFPNAAFTGNFEILEPGETTTIEFALVPATIDKIKVCGMGYTNINDETISNKFAGYWLEDEKERY